MKPYRRKMENIVAAQIRKRARRHRVRMIATRRFLMNRSGDDYDDRLLSKDEETAMTIIKFLTSQKQVCSFPVIFKVTASLVWPEKSEQSSSQDVQNEEFVIYDKRTVLEPIDYINSWIKFEKHYEHCYKVNLTYCFQLITKNGDINCGEDIEDTADWLKQCLKGKLIHCGVNEKCDIMLKYQLPIVIFQALYRSPSDDTDFSDGIIDPKQYQGITDANLIDEDTRNYRYGEIQTLFYNAILPADGDKRNKMLIQFYSKVLDRYETYKTKEKMLTLEKTSAANKKVVSAEQISNEQNKRSEPSSPLALFSISHLSNINEKHNPFHVAKVNCAENLISSCKQPMNLNKQKNITKKNDADVNAEASTKANAEGGNCAAANANSEGGDSAAANANSEGDDSAIADADTEVSDSVNVKAEPGTCDDANTPASKSGACIDTTSHSGAKKSTCGCAGTCTCAGTSGGANSNSSDKKLSPGKSTNKTPSGTIKKELLPKNYYVPHLYGIDTMSHESCLRIDYWLVLLSWSCLTNEGEVNEDMFYAIMNVLVSFERSVLKKLLITPVDFRRVLVKAQKTRQNRGLIIYKWLKDLADTCMFLDNGTSDGGYMKDLIQGIKKAQDYVKNGNKADTNVPVRSGILQDRRNIPQVLGASYQTPNQVVNMPHRQRLSEQHRVTSIRHNVATINFEIPTCPATQTNTIRRIPKAEWPGSLSEEERIQGLLFDAWLIRVCESCFVPRNEESRNRLLNTLACILKIETLPVMYRYPIQDVIDFLNSAITRTSSTAYLYKWLQYIAAQCRRHSDISDFIRALVSTGHYAHPYTNVLEPDSTTHG